MKGRGKVMDLLERYLQAVGEFLPANMKADTLAELRENLLAQMEAREEELGRSLTQAETAAVLEGHGRPILVAARYLPQHHLIGPGLFPVYWFTLKKSFPFVLLAYVAMEAVSLIFAGDRMSIGAAIGHFPSVAFTFWGVVTVGFAAFEFAQGRYFHVTEISRGWDPNSLPLLAMEGKKPSLANAVADVIVSSLILMWLLAVPYRPYLLLGPGTGYLRGMPFGLTPEWHIFYWQIIALLGVQLLLKTVILFFAGARRWRASVDIAVQVMGILVLAVMVQARSYFVPGATTSGLSVEALASVNYGINIAFKLGLAICVVKLLWDVWKLIVSSTLEHKSRVVVL
jgi:hypothetical protein